MDFFNVTTEEDDLLIRDITEVPKKEIFIHLELKIAYSILKFLPSILLVAGTVGNILSFLVFSSPALKKSHTSFLFRLLAVYDTIELQIGLWGYILTHLFQNYTLHATDSACKSKLYIRAVFRDLSVWLLCFFSIERCIGVYLPHKVKVLITRKRIHAAVIIMFVASVLINASLVVSVENRTMYDIHGNIVRQYCSTAGNQLTKNYSQVYWPWIDMFKYCFFPFTLMITCNIALIYKVIQAVSLRRQSTTQESDSNSAVSSMTIVLITISFTYIILTMPICIFFITSSTHRYIVGTYFYAQLKLWHTLGHLFAHANHCVNFYLYCVSGKQFRTELVKLFIRKK